MTERNRPLQLGRRRRMRADLDTFILDPRTLKPHPVDLMTWAHAFQETERRLLRTHFSLPTGDELYVSTVFLGLDHGFGIRLRLFETMVFGPIAADEQQWRYRSAVQAEKGHRHAVWRVRRQLVRAGVSPKRVTERFRCGA